MESIEIIKGKRYLGHIGDSKNIVEFKIVGISKSKDYIQIRLDKQIENSTYFKWEAKNNIIILDEIDEDIDD